MTYSTDDVFIISVLIKSEEQLIIIPLPTASDPYPNYKIINKKTGPSNK